MELMFNNKTIMIKECKSFFDRLKGFMFTKKIDSALLFNKCNAIHTFFMRCNIDVIMCNQDNVILYYYHNLGKNRIILPKKNVCKVIELPVDYFSIKTNEKIIIK